MLQWLPLPSLNIICEYRDDLSPRRAYSGAHSAESRLEPRGARFLSFLWGRSQSTRVGYFFEWPREGKTHLVK